MPEITDKEIEEAAYELAKNIPEWSIKLIESNLLRTKSAKLMLALIVAPNISEIGKMVITNMVASLSLGYKIGYKHAKAETLQKI